MFPERGAPLVGWADRGHGPRTGKESALRPFGCLPQFGYDKAAAGHAVGEERLMGVNREAKTARQKADRKSNGACIRQGVLLRVHSLNPGACDAVRLWQRPRGFQV